MHSQMHKSIYSMMGIDSSLNIINDQVNISTLSYKGSYIQVDKVVFDTRVIKIDDIEIHYDLQSNSTKSTWYLMMEKF